MSLWWLQPGWKKATCPHCGVNIYSSGGDPDWGECYDCKLERDQQEQMQKQPEYPCAVCGLNDAVCGVCGYSVCSRECATFVEVGVSYFLL